jgi:5-methylcytosine-specific restriction protein A
VGGTAIPALARRLVKTRDKGRCLRCGSPTRNGEWHHRRSRRVTGPHRHHPCNGVWLCHTCHTWAHKHPDEARNEGLIVSQFIEDPGTIPVLTWHGLVMLDCDGFFTHVPEELLEFKTQQESQSSSDSEQEGEA